MIDKQTFGPGELYQILPDGSKRFITKLQELALGDPPPRNVSQVTGSLMLSRRAASSRVAEISLVHEPADSPTKAGKRTKHPGTRQAPPAPRGPSVRSIRSGGAS